MHVLLSMQICRGWCQNPGKEHFSSGSSGKLQINIRQPVSWSKSEGNLRTLVTIHGFVNGLDSLYHVVFVIYLL